VARVAILFTNVKEQLGPFRDQLMNLGWIEGRNLRLDYRGAEGDLNKANIYAKELVNLKPDVILATTSTYVAALLQETSTIPIVFSGPSDPVGSGFVSSLRRPGGNVTGFLANEPSLTGKWLQLLRKLAPHTIRAIVAFNPPTTPGKGAFFLPSFYEGAREVGFEPVTAPIETFADIDPVLEKVRSGSQAGVVLLPSPFIFLHRADIAAAAIRNRLPLVGPYPETTLAGGLASYGTTLEIGFRAAAGNADRILRGEKPADLPVQTPTKFELSINLKTAKALGLEVSPALLARADEVIE
jgi:putative tryptophan/tyrosine transport system substrate-binding protein